MTPARELRIGIVVNHDAVLVPKRHDRNGRAKDQRDRGFKAGGPPLHRAERRGAPVEVRDDCGGFSSTAEEWMEGGEFLMLQKADPRPRSHYIGGNSGVNNKFPRQFGSSSNGCGLNVTVIEATSGSSDQFHLAVPQSVDFTNDLELAAFYGGTQNRRRRL